MAYLYVESGVAVNEYLYSTIGAAFDSATLAASTVTADTYGNKIVNKGTVLARVTSGTDSGKVGEYDSEASDGRQTSGNIVGISDRWLDVTRGDGEMAYLYAGTVTTAKVICDGVQGTVGSTEKAAMQSTSMNILFR